MLYFNNKHMIENEPTALDIRAAAMSEAEKAAAHELATGPGLDSIPETAIHDEGQPNVLAVEMATAEDPHREDITTMQSLIERSEKQQVALEDSSNNGVFSGLSAQEKDDAYLRPRAALQEEQRHLETSIVYKQMAAKGAARAVQLLHEQNQENN